MARIPVTLKATGQAGTVDESEFDPSIYAFGGAPSANAVTPPGGPSPVTGSKPDRTASKTPVVDAASVPNVSSSTNLSSNSSWIQDLDNGVRQLLKPVRLVAEGGRQAAQMLGNATGLHKSSGDWNSIMSKQEIDDIRQHPWEAAAKNSAEVGSYAVPFGKAPAAIEGIANPIMRAGASTVTKALLPSAAVGALNSYAQPDATLESVEKGTLESTLLGGITHGVVNAPGITKSLLTKGSEGLESSAAKKTVDASTGVIQKTIDQMGMTPEQIHIKNFPGETDVSKLIGPLEQKGKGGLVNGKLNEAEAQIKQEIDKSGNKVVASVDQLNAPILAKREVLARGTGNGDKIAELDKLIAENNSKYGAKGVTAQQLLDLKRDADTQFGKAVVEDTKGSITNQFQKVVGNEARGILKTKFDAIAEALDTQSEMLHMRPIYGKARAGLEGNGAKVSIGDVATGLGIAAPFIAKGDPLAALLLGGGSVFGKRALESPAVQQGGAKVLAGAAKITPNITSPLLRQVFGQAASRFPTGIGLTPPVNDGNTNVKQDENSASLQKVNNHDSTITQSGSNVNTMGQNNPNDTAATTEPTGSATGYSVEQLGQAYTKAVMSGDTKAASQLKSMYELESSYQKNNKDTSAPKKLTEKQTQYKAAAQGAQHALELLDKGTIKSGPIAGRLATMQGQFSEIEPDQQDYMATLALARSGLLNAFLGGNIPPAEYARISAGIPTENDPTGNAKQKLKSFMRELERFSSATVAPTTVQAAPTQYPEP